MNRDQTSGSLRVYRQFLRLYPSEFRKEYGDEMLFCFRDSLRAAHGTPAFARLWIETVLDLISSVLKENWQSLKLMNPKNGRNSRTLRIIGAYPFGSTFAVLAAACIVVLGIQLRTHDFSAAGYFMAMTQVTVLSLIILISGFIVDIENRCMRLLRQEVMVSSLIACTFGIGLMAVGIHRLQFLELTFEQLLPLVLQIVICGTIWVQLVMLNEIRILYRVIRRTQPIGA